ncbi:MAG: aldo/keto reductase [Phycisphaeraceae bacterium]|nr:aldo/keto reductase [Phycisphaeraceae bacterium]
MSRVQLPTRPFPTLEREVGVISLGAFKIGRRDPGKYATDDPLPSDAESTSLIHGAIDFGIDLIDTAPAYGLSEARVGAALASRHSGVVISTKAGEELGPTGSIFNYSEAAIEASVCRSLVRLRRPSLDLVFIHSDGNDLHILGEGTAVATLDRLRRQGLLRAVGFSGKRVEGGLAALNDPRINAVMVEYNPASTSQLPVIEMAGRLGKAVLVKKPLAQGRLAPEEAIPFILARPEVTTVVIGSLRLEHLERACRIAAGVTPRTV